jgi:hypothetical protein
LNWLVRGVIGSVHVCEVLLLNLVVEGRLAAGVIANALIIGKQFFDIIVVHMRDLDVLLVKVVGLVRHLWLVVGQAFQLVHGEVLDGEHGDGEAVHI